MDTSNWIAIDVEKVPTPYGAEPSEVSIVNYDNKIIYKTYIKPRGIPKSEFVKRGLDRVAHLSKPYNIVKEEVKEILRDKIIIGHDLDNEFRAFELNEDEYKTIDTAKLPIFSIITLRPRRLKDLVKEVLNKDIQIGKHSATEDAIATMNIVKKYEKYLDLDVPVLARDVSLSQKIIDASSRITLSSGGSRKTYKNLYNRTRRLKLNKLHHSKKIEQLNGTIKSTSKHKI